MVVGFSNHRNVTQVQVSSTECVHIRLYQNLQQQLSLTSVQDGKTLDDPITYF